MSTQQNSGQQPPDFLADFMSGRGAVTYRRFIFWGSAFVGLIILFVLLNLAKGVYTELLWFDSVGYKSVYSKILVTRVWLFFAGAILFSALFLANIVLALRLARRHEPAPLPPETVLLIRSATIAGVAFFTLIFAIVFGSVASGQWENFLLFTNSGQFLDPGGAPIADPFHGHNPSFYILSLPLMRFVQTWLLGVVMLLILGALGIYGAGFSLRGFRMAFPRGVYLHVAILVAILTLFVAWSYWFDIKELVLSSRGLGGSLFGASATDVSAKRFALYFMMAVTTLGSIAAIASVFRKGFGVPLGAFGLWLGSVIIILTLYPTAYQRFSVQPNELVRETPYISHNINMTKEAFGLSKITTKEFVTGAELPAEADLKNAAVVDNIRLWDHRPLRETLNQIQVFRPYYTFSDVDVDRYDFGSGTRQVMLAARELVPENLPEEAQNWVAKRLQYTHGYGVAMSPVNTFTGEGRPEFFLKDLPPVGDIEVTQPEVYFGERTASYVIIGTDTEEFDYPTETAQFTKYQGDGGVHISSWLRKFAFAWRFADLNLLISGEVTPESRILMRRQIQDRVSSIAPFLELDRDPYLVVADGGLSWIQDAYTITNRFPYSQPFPGETSPFQQDFNYIRNSVKVVVNAYTGDVDFYVMDPSDALLRTYSKIFTELFKPIDEMPPSVRRQIRFPEGLFDVQEFMYRSYHVTDPRVFFSREDLWSRPTETFYGSAGQLMEAYYVILPLPGEVEPEFLLLLPMTPLNRPNLVSWLAARSDGENYGELVAYTFPRDRQVDGPQQVEARISNDPLIAQQFTLWGQQGSRIIRGNLLVIPVGDTLLYVEPVYLQAESLNFPELRRVIVAIGDRSPVMEPTLDLALDVALGKAEPSPPLGGLSSSRPEPGVTPTPEPATPEPVATLTGDERDFDALIRDVERFLEDLKRLRDQ